MYRHLLVPLDGSPLAEQILPHVHALAANEGTSLITLLRAVAPVLTGSAEFTGMAMAAASEGLEAGASAYLDRIAETFRAEGYKVRTEISNLPPADAILDYADTRQVDLIAIATHGYSGFTRFVFGSVTQKVLQAASVPMLVVRPKHN